MKTIFAALGLFCLVMVAYAGQPEKSEWAGFEFLVGDWVADRDNQTAASGDFSFRFAAGGKVLVRRNAADYPAANGRQSSHHEDLLVIYREHDNGPASAMYFDSEGHVIRYEVAVDAKLHRVQLLSNSSDATPRFRDRDKR
jgi:hypothetical protein